MSNQQQRITTEPSFLPIGSSLLPPAEDFLWPFIVDGKSPKALERGIDKHSYAKAKGREGLEMSREERNYAGSPSVPFKLDSQRAFGRDGPYEDVHSSGTRESPPLEHELSTRLEDPYSADWTIKLSLSPSLISDPPPPSHFSDDSRCASPIDDKSHCRQKSTQSDQTSSPPFDKSFTPSSWFTRPNTSTASFHTSPTTVQSSTFSSPSQSSGESNSPSSPSSSRFGRATDLLISLGLRKQLSSGSESSISDEEVQSWSRKAFLVGARKDLAADDYRNRCEQSDLQGLGLDQIDDAGLMGEISSPEDIQSEYVQEEENSLDSHSSHTSYYAGAPSTPTSSWYRDNSSNDLYSFPYSVLNSTSTSRTLPRSSPSTLDDVVAVSETNLSSPSPLGSLALDHTISLSAYSDPPMRSSSPSADVLSSARQALLAKAYVKPPPRPLKSAARPQFHQRDQTPSMELSPHFQKRLTHDFGSKTRRRSERVASNRCSGRKAFGVLEDWVLASEMMELMDLGVTAE